MKSPSVFARVFAATLATGAVALLIAGCAATVPAPVLLTLPPAALSQPLTAMPPSAPSASPLLAVRRVNIPEYVVARRVRYRADASTLAEWPNTYWGERIEIGVAREFVAALRGQLPGWSMCDMNCGDLVPALELQVDLAPLDYVRSAQKLSARARLTVSSSGLAPKMLQTQDIAYEVPAPSDTPQGQAQAIAMLIQHVAAAAAPLVRAAQAAH